MGEGSVKSRLRPPRTIDRPRLTRMLDASSARVMLLIAPAGYGKTTLTRQWFAPGDKVAMWHRATQASSDVAALGASIARAADEFLPGVGDRLTQVIRHTAAPARDVEDLVTAFVEELAPFPAGGWLVLDDYHFIVASAASERLIEALTEVPGLRMLIATRRRPRWATVRRSLYGEVAEMGQAELAFTEEEAADLLRHLPPESVTDFVERTKGWPAVLQLASVSGGRELPDSAVQDDLHNYFAEELFQAATPALQDALVRLALLPTLRPALLDLALGPDYEAICDEAVTLGFLAEDAKSTLEFHPLLREFIGPRARQLPETMTLAQRIVEALLSEKRWDDAFAVVLNSQRADLLPLLFSAALDDLLTESRLSTLEQWVAHATSEAAAFPLLDLAEAEIARRLGDFELGEVRAVQAARTLRDDSTFVSRAWAVAGECAHLAARVSDALVYHERAEQTATNDRDARRAVWGQHVIAAAFEVVDVRESLARLEELDDGSPAATIRSVIGELNRSILLGGLEEAVAKAWRHRHLLSRVTDPLITTSFFMRLGWAATMAGQYSQGYQRAQDGVAEAERTRSSFAVIHFAPVLIGASIGLRRFRHAAILLDDLVVRLQTNGNPYEAANAAIFRARLLISQGATQEASAFLDFDQIASAPTPALRLEGASVLALAQAVDGDAETALDAAHEALKESKESQGVVLTAFAQAIEADVAERDDALDLLAKAIDLLRSTGNYDSFVYAYRVYPRLLKTVIEEHLLPRGKLADVIRNAMDTRLAASAGMEIEPTPSPHQSLLTPREVEVYALVCKGLSNQEIADALVISLSTAKVHVRHVLKKIGAPNRKQAIRASQETL